MMSSLIFSREPPPSHACGAGPPSPASEGGYFGAPVTPSPACGGGLGGGFPRTALPHPLRNRRADLVGLVELGEVAGAGDDADLGLAGDAVGEFVGVTLRHDA